MGGPELCECWSPLHGKAAAPLHPLPHLPPSPCSSHPTLSPGRSFEGRSWGGVYPHPHLPITLARVPPRSKALPGALISPAAAIDQHHQVETGGQAAAQGPCPLLRVSVPVQAPAPLAQDPPWDLQEPLLGEFSSLTWTGQEHKSLLGGDHMSWLKGVLQSSLLLQEGAKPPLKYSHRDS